MIIRRFLFASVLTVVCSSILATPIASVATQQPVMTSTLPAGSFHHNEQTVRSFKNVMQHNPVYFFNTALNTLSPNTYTVLRDTTAFYQRQRTNQLLRQLVRRESKKPQQPTIPFSSGPDALWLPLSDGTRIAFFHFIEAYHGERFVHDCVIPLVKNGEVILQQLHRAHTIFSVLQDRTVYPYHHCEHRTHTWAMRFATLANHPNNVHATMQALQLTNALQVIEGSTVGTDTVRAKALNTIKYSMQHSRALKNSFVTALLHPTNTNVTNMLTLQRHLAQASAAVAPSACPLVASQRARRANDGVAQFDAPPVQRLPLTILAPTIASGNGGIDEYITAQGNSAKTADNETAQPVPARVTGARDVNGSREMQQAVKYAAHYVMSHTPKRASAADGNDLPQWKAPVPTRARG